MSNKKLSMTIEIHKNFMEWQYSINVKNTIIDAINNVTNELSNISCENCNCHRGIDLIKIDKKLILKLVNLKELITKSIENVINNELKLFKSIYKKYPQTLEKDFYLNDLGEIIIA